MTPMPKLLNSISNPLPADRKCSHNSSDKQELLDPASQKQAEMQAEFLSQDRVQRLKQDLTETPNSKYKYKQISREMKE